MAYFSEREGDLGVQTKLGNDFMIRHTEVGKIQITTSEDIDYFFHRMFAMVRRILNPERKFAMRLAIRAAVLIFALQLFPTCLAAQAPADELSSELEKAAVEEMKAADIPGAAIGIVSGGKILLVKGLGVASVETSVPVTADTLFRLGSTTKMFTAAALVQMALETKEMTLAEMSEYVGVYNNGGEPVEIFIREGSLFLRVGKSELQLSKIGDHRLMMKEPGTAAPDGLVMLPDKSGRIAYIQVGSGALNRQR